MIISQSFFFPGVSHRVINILYGVLIVIFVYGHKAKVDQTTVSHNVHF